jgi:hypothetical protein
MFLKVLLQIVDYHSIALSPNEVHVAISEINDKAGGGWVKRGGARCLLQTDRVVVQKFFEGTIVLTVAPMQRSTLCIV